MHPWNTAGRSKLYINLRVKADSPVLEGKPGLRNRRCSERERCWRKHLAASDSVTSPANAYWITAGDSPIEGSSAPMGISELPGIAFRGIVRGRDRSPEVPLNVSDVVAMTKIVTKIARKPPTQMAPLTAAENVLETVSDSPTMINNLKLFFS